MAEADFRVVVGDGVIEHHRPDGIVETIRRDELMAVVIETNNLGPFATDVFWLLLGEREGKPCGCYIPAGATGEDDLFKELQKLAGFDNAAFIDAMASTDNARFVVWRCESEGSPRSPIID
ncbi:MAG: hypothetical protein ACAI34_18320 [Verrucomicrobium sp.]